ncbi:hypothetical protein NKH77_41410 [Streptomyces sp. M19]
MGAAGEGGERAEDGALRREIRMYDGQRAPDGSDIITTVAYLERPLPPVGWAHTGRRARTAAAPPSCGPTRTGSASWRRWSPGRRPRAARRRTTWWTRPGAARLDRPRTGREGGRVRTRWTVRQAERLPAVGTRAPFLVGHVVVVLARPTGDGLSSFVGDGTGRGRRGVRSGGSTARPSWTGTTAATSSICRSSRTGGTSGWPPPWSRWSRATRAGWATRGTTSRRSAPVGPRRTGRRRGVPPRGRRG